MSDVTATVDRVCSEVETNVQPSDTNFMGQRFRISVVCVCEFHTFSATVPYDDYSRFGNHAAMFRQTGPHLNLSSSILKSPRSILRTADTEVWSSSEPSLPNPASLISQPSEPARGTLIFF